MRVLLIANTLPPMDVSGVGEQVVQLATGLEARGHRVKIVGRASRGLASRKGLFPLAVVPIAIRELRRFRPDVVQVHESDAALAAVAVRLQRRWLRPRPLLVALLQVSYVEERRAVRALSADGGELGRPSAVERRFRRFKAPLQIVLGRLTARAADLVLTPSRQTAREVERDYGVRGVEVLPNVTGGLQREIDTGRLTGLPDCYLLFVGRLRIRKGVEVLLAALAWLRDEGVELPLVVGGDGEHRGFLERRAGELGLASQVRFLGRCGPEEVRGLLRQGRCLVVPSIYEGMPLVVLEAMEAGLPVVASAVSGIPEVVVDGETGWLVPPEDPGALAGALRAAWDVDEARRRGQAGRARVEQRFRPHHAAAQWEELVGSI
ncbi:MAG: glycosyltransferase family 4 protein [Thermoanaerobaculia bacterium]